MKIALLGYGKMGRAIEKVVQERGHQVVATLGRGDALSSLPAAVDVAIEFSTPEAAVANLEHCLKNGIPVVCGTTGWLERYDAMTSLCQRHNGALLYASNFSVGVNLFFELNKQLATLMAHYPDYRVEIEEIHHTQKRDAPSGTAITLAEGIIENSAYNTWELQGDGTGSENEIPITAKREGDVKGTHGIAYHSPIDSISIRHKAHSREGFAQGAVLAAEWLQGKTGVFSMRDVLFQKSR